MPQDESKDKVVGRSAFGAADAAPLKVGRVWTVVGTFVAAIAALALFTAPAQATTGYVFNNTFGIPGSNDPGGFAFGISPYGVAVNSSNGHVFATDPWHTDSNGQFAPRVEEFDASGAFQAEFPLDPATYNTPRAVAVDPSGAGAVYVSANSQATSKNVVLKYSLTGSFQYALVPEANTGFNTSALTVDPSSGDVYVGAVDSTSGASLVEVFDNAGAFQSSFTGATNNDSPLGSVVSVAVDGSSHVYIIDGGKNRVDRFSTAGSFETTVVDGNANGASLIALAANSSSDEVYVSENAGGTIRLAYFTVGGAALRGETTVGANIVSIAANPTTSSLYLADIGQALVLIGTTFIGPTVETTGSSSVDSTTQTLEGTINPEGTASEYHFDYGPDANYGSSTTSTSAGSGSTTLPVSDQATGLLPNSTYHFRIVGTNSDGVIQGKDQSFTTAPAPPVLDGTPPNATNLKYDGATFNGVLNPRGSDTTWHWEYGTVPGGPYASTTSNTVGAAQGDQQLPPVPVTGLTPGTQYYFRLVADNGTGGPIEGQEASFMTAPAAAAGGSPVTGNSATLFGTVNAQGLAITYHFEYGETTSYGSSTPESDLFFDPGDVVVTRPVDQLRPGTTYHVRVVAKNFITGVTITGKDGTFTTDPAPGAVTGAVTGVTTDRAIFSGEVDTHGHPGSYRFYVESPTSPFTARTEVVTVPASSGPTAVSASLTGLQPGQAYTVRLSVASSQVISVGDAVSFSTAPLPAVSPGPPPNMTDNPYGCSNPTLKAYNNRPKPGDMITVSGLDLGVGGTIALGSETITPSSWGGAAFSFVLPDDATGSLPLTINCGKVSNTIAIQMFKAPSNSFTIKSKVSRSTATLTLKVPGPGDITVKGAGVKGAKRHAGKAGSYSIKAILSATGKKSLRRHKTLARSLSVTFKPNDGTAATKTVKVTYKR